MPIMLQSFISASTRIRYSRQLVEEMLSDKLESAVNGKRQHVDEHVALGTPTKNRFFALDCPESAVCKYEFESKDTHGEVSEDVMRNMVLSYLDSERALSDMCLYYNHALSTNRGLNRSGRIVVKHRLHDDYGSASIFQKGKPSRMKIDGIKIIFDIDEDGSMFVFTAFPICEEQGEFVEQTIVGTKTEYVKASERRAEPGKYNFDRAEVYEPTLGPTKNIIYNFDGDSYTKFGDNLQSIAIHNQFAPIYNVVLRGGAQEKGEFFVRSKDDVRIVESESSIIKSKREEILKALDDIRKSEKFVKGRQLSDESMNGTFTIVQSPKKKSPPNSTSQHKVDAAGSQEQDFLLLQQMKATGMVQEREQEAAAGDSRKKKKPVKRILSMGIPVVRQ